MPKQYWSILSNIAEPSYFLWLLTRKARWILCAAENGANSGLQVHGIRSRRLVCKEVAEVLSNCEKKEILLLVIWEVRIENDQARVSPGLVWGKRGDGQCDLVCVERL